jgi:hypothetical protein
MDSDLVSRTEMCVLVLASLHLADLRGTGVMDKVQTAALIPYDCYSFMWLSGHPPVISGCIER